MSLVRKLKPDRNITGAVIPLSMIPIFGITSLLFGLPTGLIILGVMMWALFPVLPCMDLCARGIRPNWHFAQKAPFLDSCSWYSSQIWLE